MENVAPVRNSYIIIATSGCFVNSFQPDFSSKGAASKYYRNPLS